MAMRFVENVDYNSFLKKRTDQCKAFIDSAKRNKFDPNKINDCLIGLKSIQQRLKDGVHTNDKRDELVKFLARAIVTVETIQKAAGIYKTTFDELQQKNKVFGLLARYINATESSTHRLDNVTQLPPNAAWLNVHKELKKAVHDLLQIHHQLTPVLQGLDIQQFHNKYSNVFYAQDIQPFCNAITNVINKARNARGISCPHLPTNTADTNLNATHTALNTIMAAIQQAFDNNITPDADVMLEKVKETIRNYSVTVKNYITITG